MYVSDSLVLEEGLNITATCRVRAGSFMQVSPNFPRSYCQQQFYSSILVPNPHAPILRLEAICLPSLVSAEKLFNYNGGICAMT